MTKTEFWSLIEKVKGNDVVLEKTLMQMKATEVRQFCDIFDEYHIKLYREDVWYVGQLINGWLSDDRFNDFRNWIIAMGRDFYMGVDKNPDSLIELMAARGIKGKGDYIHESFGYAGPTAYENLTGRYPGRRSLKVLAKDVDLSIWYSPEFLAKFPKMHKALNFKN